MSSYNTLLFTRSYKGPKALLYKAPGIQRIATEIRNKGMTCQVINHMNWFTDEEYENLLLKYIGNNTKIIGFSTTFWRQAGINDLAETIYFVNRIIDYVLLNYPHIKIIAGGSEATDITREYFKKIDAIFLDFPEDILSEYLVAIRDGLPLPKENQICEKTGALIYKTTGKFNFSESEILYEPNDYITQKSTVNIEVGRGCIFKCKFCSFKLNGKKKLDYLKDIDVLKKELINNYEKYQIQTYIFTDDTFNDSVFKVESLHNLFTSLPFKIYFSAYLRLDLLNAHKEQIYLLKNMGLVGAFFGIETFHPRAASNIGKGLNPVTAKKLLSDLKTIHWGNTVKIATSLIIGLPYETLESYEETKKWISDPENLIDKIPVYPLHVTNPSIYPDGNLSEFALNSASNGFYWPSNSVEWKNFNGPIKSFVEAQTLCDEFQKITKSVDKHEIVGNSMGPFEILISWDTKPEKFKNISFDEFNNMSVTEYAEWKLLQDISGKIREYKYKILNINN